MSSKELLTTLEEMGVTGRSASSSVPEDMVPRLRASGGKKTTAPKRREILEPPPSSKPKRAKAAQKPAQKPAAPAAAPASPAAVPAAVPAEPAPAPQAPAPAAALIPAEPAVPSLPVMRFIRGSTPQTIADKAGRSPAEIVKILFTAGEMATATSSLSDEAIAMVASELGHSAEIVGV